MHPHLAYAILGGGFSTQSYKAYILCKTRDAKNDILHISGGN